MELYSEIPDHRDSNGNKNRSIFKYPSPDKLPEIQKGSMFFFLFAEQDLRTSCHILDEKMRDFGNATELIFNPILNKEAPEGWYKQEIILPTLQGDRGIYLFRSNQHAEQVIVLADDLAEILRGQKFFDQGCTVSTMLQRFQVSVFLHARRLVNMLVKADVASPEASHLLKRVGDKFKYNWELSQAFFDREEDWNEVYGLVKIAVRNAESAREYLATQAPTPSPITINARRDVNMAGRDMHHHNPISKGDNMLKAIIGAVIAGLIVAFIAYKLGWMGIPT